MVTAVRVVGHKPAALSSRLSRCLDIANRDHQIEWVRWRTSEAEPLVELRRLWVQRRDHKHPHADGLARGDGEIHRMAEQPSADAVTLSLSIDGQAAEQDRGDLSWCLASSTTCRSAPKHCES